MLNLKCDFKRMGPITGFIPYAPRPMLPIFWCKFVGMSGQLHHLDTSILVMSIRPKWPSDELKVSTYLFRLVTYLQTSDLFNKCFQMSYPFHTEHRMDETFVVVMTTSILIPVICISHLKPISGFSSF